MFMQKMIESLVPITYLPKSREKKVGVIMLRVPGQNRVVQGLLDCVLFWEKTDILGNARKNLE